MCAGRPVNLTLNCAKHILAELKHYHLDDLERKNSQKAKKAASVNQYIQAIDSLSQEHAAGHQSLNKRKRQPRGNHGFFKHIQSLRPHLPRKCGEAYSEYLARLNAAGKETWKVLGFKVLNCHCHLSESLLLNYTVISNVTCLPVLLCKHCCYNYLHMSLYLHWLGQRG